MHKLGHIFEILVYPSRSSIFDTFIGLELGGGWAFELIYDDATGVTVTVLSR